jgi:hypothetical protein
MTSMFQATVQSTPVAHPRWEPLRHKRAALLAWYTARFMPLGPGKKGPPSGCDGQGYRAVLVLCSGSGWPRGQPGRPVLRLLCPGVRQTAPATNRRALPRPESRLDTPLWRR